MKGNFSVVLEGDARSSEPWSLTYYRYRGDPAARGRLPWKLQGDNTKILAIEGAHFALDRASADELANRVLIGLDDGSIQFEEGDYQTPLGPDFVEDIARPDVMCFARIMKWKDGKYEALYFAYAPDVDYVPAQTPSISKDADYSWGRPNIERKTFGDDLKELRVAARAELEEIVASNPRIKRTSDVDRERLS